MNLKCPYLGCLIPQRANLFVSKCFSDWLFKTILLIKSNDFRKCIFVTITSSFDNYIYWNQSGYKKPLPPCRSTQRQLTHEEKLVLTWYSGEVLCCYLPDSGHWKWVKIVHILNVNSHTNTTCKKRQKHLHCYAFFEMIPPPQKTKNNNKRDGKPSWTPKLSSTIYHSMSGFCIHFSHTQNQIWDNL